jgi:hypothetical protein
VEEYGLSFWLSGLNSIGESFFNGERMETFLLKSLNLCPNYTIKTCTPPIKFTSLGECFVLKIPNKL